MKKIYIFILSLIMVQHILAQEEEDDYKTVFEDGIERISGFGGPMYNLSMVNGDFAIFSGGGGGLLINDFFIGGYGFGSSPIQYTRNQEITMSYGGIWMGYSLFGNKPFHPTFSLQTGWGKIKTDDKYSMMSSVPYYGFEDRIFVVTPEAGLELNIARFFRFSAAFNYRLVAGLDDNSYLGFGDASGIGMNISFKFGWF